MWYEENLQTYSPRKKACTFLSSLEMRNFPIGKTKEKLKILYETKLLLISLILHFRNLGVL